MKDVKIIALDLDGTLLNSKKELTCRNLSALRSASERGIEIVPTTGRFYGGMPEEIRCLPFIHYAITINGAQVQRLSDGKVLYRSEIPRRQAVEVMEMLDRWPVAYDCYCDNHAFMTGAMQEKIEEYTADIHYQRMVRQLRQGVPELKAWVVSQHHDIQKVQFFTENRAVKAQLMEELAQKFPELIVTSAIPSNVEINQRGANKGQALLALAEHLGCTAEQVMAFGDGLNDITMIQAAGTGVVMGNGFPEVKAVADRLAEDCDHDGVAQVIEELCLG